ncbi:hypothetical protein DFJ74DRAFT_460571 [Hyaloraphidium curvatum]|nr:hypothetical protein DFJ74DRAFT_460571 [Hyaloraphidium curvatum]
MVNPKDLADAVAIMASAQGPTMPFEMAFLFLLCLFLLCLLLLCLLLCLFLLWQIWRFEKPSFHRAAPSPPQIGAMVSAEDALSRFRPHAYLALAAYDDPNHFATQSVHDALGTRFRYLANRDGGRIWIFVPDDPARSDQVHIVLRGTDTMDDVMDCIGLVAAAVEAKGDKFLEAVNTVRR